MKALSNVALRKPTSQSSNHSATDLSGLGVDGNILGSYFHTQLDKQAWWKVNLEGDFLINGIMVYTCVDYCTERLDNFLSRY